MYSQKWNCAALFPIPLFMYLWDIYIFPVSVLFGCGKIGRPILGYINCPQIHECGIWETEHYKSVLEITRPSSFISGKAYIGTRHFFGFSPALHLQCRPDYTEGERGAKKPVKYRVIYRQGFLERHKSLIWLLCRTFSLLTTHQKWLARPWSGQRRGNNRSTIWRARIKFMGMFTVLSIIPFPALHITFLLSRLMAGFW